MRAAAGGRSWFAAGVAAALVVLSGRGEPLSAQIGPGDPENYQFQHVWKARVQAVRAARARLESPGLSLSADELQAGSASLTGTFRFPIIAGAFSDLGGPYSQAAYQQRLFGDGSGTVSVRALYEEMSRGVFSVNGTVTDWVTLSQTRAFYEPSAATDETFGRSYEFITESLTAVDGSVDFSQFDNDGPDGVPNSGDDDGIVDLAAFIYPTQAKSCGGTGIWPHKYHYRWLSYDATGVLAWFYTDDPSAEGGTILIGDYIIQSGIECDGVSLMGSGTLAHELGHALDLPDLYDVDRGDGTASQGVGYWDLMGSGNYNRSTSPAHFSAWSKDLLGWLDVETISSSRTGISLPPVQTAGVVVRVDIPSSNEHFLLSNRQALGSDQYVNGTGLLIWHIDRDLAGSLSEVGNQVNKNAERKGVDLEEADGLDDLDESRNRGDDGDPYPGASNAREFHAGTYPSSRSYAGGLCGVGIRNISDAGGTVSFDLTVGERWALWGDADGSGSVTDSDVAPIYWYFLGYRDPEEQGAVPNGDVDGDGDVDLMDGFLLDSSLSGIPVPGTRIGGSEWMPCDPSASPALASPVPAEARARGGGVDPPSSEPKSR